MRITAAAASGPRFVLSTLLFLATVLSAASPCSAQSVVTRARIGGYAEDMAFVTSGPLKDSIVLLEGSDLYTVPYPRKPKGDPMTHLADLRKTGMENPARGITFVESEGLLAINDDVGTRKGLLLFDQTGALVATRTVQYLGGYVPTHIEGLGYIPASSPNFPDHLVMVVWDNLFPGPSRIEVLQRSGQVVAEIFPAIPPGEDGLMGDVSYAGPNRLHVTNYSGEIWTVDFTGAVVGGPLVTGLPGFEGIATTTAGAVVALGFPQSLLAFDAALDRVPANDRFDVVGLGVDNVLGAAWNSATGQFLVSHNFASPSLQVRIAAVAPSLGAASTYFDVPDLLSVAQLSYVPGDDLVAVLRRSPQPFAIDLYQSDGTLHSQVDLSDTGFGTPNAFEYIPTTDQFAVRFQKAGDPAESARLRFFSRAGAHVGTLELGCVGAFGIGDMAFFNPSHPSGGQLLMFVGFGRMMVVNLDGTHATQFNTQLRLKLPQALGVAAITTGPHAGAFCIVDNYTGELVVFTLN